jgi:cytoskeletal protein RodZ
MKIAPWGLVILLVSPVGIAVAQQQQDQAPPQPAQQSQSVQQQQQQDPVAAAARRTREEKKDQPKAAKVFDNDNIPASPGGINVVGQTEPAVGDPANPPAANQGAIPGPVPPNTVSGGNAADGAALSTELNAAKGHLLSLQKDLDILQRTFTLDEQMFLIKPDHESDRAGAAKLKDERDQIADKQQEVVDTQKKVDDLQAKLGASGGGTPK